MPKRCSRCLAESVMSEKSSLTRREFVAAASLAAVSASIASPTTVSDAQPRVRNSALSRAFDTSTPPSPDWPVLARYDAKHLTRIAMPIGGIGAGTISLGGRGDLRDWELVNRPAKGYAPPNTFFALWMKPDGAAPITRALEGPLDAMTLEG